MAIHIGIDIAGSDDTDTSIEVTIDSYEKFLADEAKASESVAGKCCFVAGCTNPPPYYRVGDARYWCGMCEEHANMRDRYRNYVQTKLDNALLTGLARAKVQSAGGNK